MSMGTRWPERGKVARFAPGSPDRERHLKDYRDLLAALDRQHVTMDQLRVLSNNLREQVFPGLRASINGAHHEQPPR